MQSTRPKHYLSSEYQLKGLEKLELKINNAIVEYLNKKTSSTAELGVTLDKLEEKLRDNKTVSKKQCMHSLNLEFRGLTKECKDDIQYKGTNNNELLLTYLNSLIGKLAQAKHIINKIEEVSKPNLFSKSTMPAKLDELIALCESQKKYLEHATDVRIYQVFMPQADYAKLFDESKYFHDEATIKVAAKTVGGAILFLPAVVASAAMVAGNVLHGAVEDVETSAKAGLFFAKKTVSGMTSATRYGYFAKTTIERGCIKGELTEKNEIKIGNPYFDEKKEEAPHTMIYILDGRSPGVVFKEGVNYKNINDPTINPHGQVIFYHNLNDALRSAECRSNGFYDEIAGWCVDRPWTEKELAVVHRSAVLSQTTAQGPSSESSSTEKKDDTPTTKPPI